MLLVRLVPLVAVEVVQAHQLPVRVPGQQVCQQQNHEQVTRVEVADVAVVVDDLLRLGPCRRVPDPHVGAVLGFDLLAGQRFGRVAAIVVQDANLGRLRVGHRGYRCVADVLAVDVLDADAGDVLVEHRLSRLLVAADGTGHQAERDHRSDRGIDYSLHGKTFQSLGGDFSVCSCV